MIGYGAMDQLLPHKQVMEIHFKERMGHFLTLSTISWTMSYLPAIATISTTVEEIVEAMESSYGKADRVWVMDVVLTAQVMRRNNLTHEIEDRLLLKRAIHETCPQAMSEIYRKYKPFLANYIADKIHVQDDKQDLVHTVFLRLCQGKCQYTGDTDVQGYLCGVAKNVLQEHMRSKKRHIQFNSSIEIKISGDLLVTRNQTGDPSNTLQKAEILQTIRKEVTNLPEKSRQAVELVYFEDIPVAEAAIKAGCKVKTFQDRLYHGFALLSKALEVHRKMNIKYRHSLNL